MLLTTWDNLEHYFRGTLKVILFTSELQLNTEGFFDNNFLEVISLTYESFH